MLDDLPVGLVVQVLVKVRRRDAVEVPEEVDHLLDAGVAVRLAADVELDPVAGGQQHRLAVGEPGPERRQRRGGCCALNASRSHLQRAVVWFSPRRSRRFTALYELHRKDRPDHQDKSDDAQEGRPAARKLGLIGECKTSAYTSHTAAPERSLPAGCVFLRPISAGRR